jgi:hypothetical protein
MIVHEPGTVRSPKRNRQATQERPPHHANRGPLACGQDRQCEVVVDQAAIGRLVLLDSHLHHRAEGGLRDGISGHSQCLLMKPASTGNVTPVM